MTPKGIYNRAKSIVDSLLYFRVCFPMGGEIFRYLRSTLIYDAILFYPTYQCYNETEASLLTTQHTNKYALQITSTQTLINLSSNEPSFVIVGHCLVVQWIFLKIVSFCLHLVMVPFCYISGAPALVSFSASFRHRP